MKHTVNILRSRFTAILAVVLTVVLVGSALSGSAFVHIESERFLTEEAALEWQAEQEAAFALRDDGLAYSLSWDGPHRQVVGLITSELVADGDATTTEYGPFPTLEAAQAALDAQRLADVSLPQRQVSFSPVFSEVVEGVTTYGFTKSVQSFHLEETTTETVRYSISYTVSVLPAIAPAASHSIGGVVICCQGDGVCEESAVVVCTPQPVQASEPLCIGTLIGAGAAATAFSAR